jgi:peptidoglycan/LPS O-acetylase OafA/YrhL
MVAPMSDPQPAAAPHAFAWIDAMRFVAAALVVMEHARDLLFLTYTEIPGRGPFWQGFYFVTGFGSEAVLAFFVISGFWITAAVERRVAAPGFWLGYLIDRLSRLLIVLAPALAIGAALDAVSAYLLQSPYAAGTSGALTLPAPVADSMSFGIWLGNLAFLQSLFVPTFGSNGPLWSLAYEFWYYVWFPSLLLALRYRRFGAGLLTLALAVAFPALAKGFVVWLMGSALFYLDRRARLTGQGSPAARFQLVLAMGVLAAVLTGSRLGWAVFGHSFVLGGAFALVLWAVLRLDPALPRALRPMAAYGAGGSFSLYAAHFPLLLVTASLLPPQGRTAPDAARLATWLGILAFALAWGWLFSRLTEAHTAKLRAALRTRFLVPTPAR